MMLHLFHNGSPFFVWHGVTLLVSNTVPCRFESVICRSATSALLFRCLYISLLHFDNNSFHWSQAASFEAKYLHSLPEWSAWAVWYSGIRRNKLPRLYFFFSLSFYPFLHYEAFWVSRRFPRSTGAFLLSGWHSKPFFTADMWIFRKIHPSAHLPLLI